MLVIGIISFKLSRGSLLFVKRYLICQIGSGSLKNWKFKNVFHISIDLKKVWNRHTFGVKTRFIFFCVKNIALNKHLQRTQSILILFVKNRNLNSYSE